MLTVIVSTVTYQEQFNYLPSFQTPHYEWHKTYTSIDRIDMMINAGKALASIYKVELQSKVPATAGKGDTN